MSYWALNAIFLAVVAAVGVAAVVVSAVRAARVAAVARAAGRSSGNPVSRADAPGRLAVAVALTAGVLLLLTAVFDNVMISIGLVGYDPAHISGVFVGVAPLEDFAYAIAAVVLLPSLWVLLGRASDAASHDGVAGEAGDA